MSKKTIIEIVGLPGSGKSFIADRLKGSDIIEILDEKRFYSMCSHICLLKKLFYTIVLIPKILKIKRLLPIVLKNRGVTMAEAKKENSDFCKYFVLQRIIIDSIKKDYILLDQWNIQNVISLELLSDAPLDCSRELGKLLYLLAEGYNYYPLFYDVGIDTIIKRLYGREKKFKMDDMDCEILRRYYGIHHDDYKKIGKEYFNSHFDTFSDLLDLKKKIGEIC